MSTLSILSPTFEGDLADEILKLCKVVKEDPFNTILVAAGLTGAYIIYDVFKRARSLNQLQGPPSPSFFLGHLPLFYDPVNSGSFYTKLRNEYGVVCRLKGMMGEDQLWVSDPRALQEIAIKENDSFLISKEFTAFMEVTVGRNILIAHGERHKLQRKLLTPAFTPKHLRALVSTFNALTQQLENALVSDIKKEGCESATVDVFKWINLVSLEMIGQAGLGHSFEVMEGKGEELLEALGRLVPAMAEMWWIRPFLPWLKNVGPGFFRRFIVERVPLTSVRELVKITDILSNMAADIYQRKKETVASGNSHNQVGSGNDIMTLLLKQNEILPSNERMPEHEVISQIFGLVFAGSDTTSSAITAAIHLLTQHPEIQNSLRTEVQEAQQQYGQELDYEQLNSLSLLDAVCRESLRLFPSQPIVERTAMNNWTLPLHQPVNSSDRKTTVTHVPVKKGTQIYIALDAANRDKQIWGDDADEFKPSRWLGDLPLSVKDAKIPAAYSSIMSFWGGSKACIGLKFSQLEMKVVLSRLFSRFKFEYAQETIGFNIDGVYRPYVVRENGTRDASPSMPLKVTVIDGSD